MKTTISILLALTIATDLHAQRVSDAQAGYAEAPPAPASPAPVRAPVYYREPSTLSMALTGTAFAAGGIMAGASVGRSLEGCDAGNGDCGFGGAILGAIAGEILMLPLGVHVASDRSTFKAKVRMSAAMTLAGLTLAPMTGGLSILMIPPAQLIATVAVEKNALRRQAKAR